MFNGSVNKPRFFRFILFLINGIIANDFIKSFKARDKDEYRETRILEEGNELIGSDVRIFGNKIAMLSFKEGFIGVIIESEDLHKLNKILFERVWETLKV